MKRDIAVLAGPEKLVSFSNVISGFSSFLTKTLCSLLQTLSEIKQE